MIQNRLSACNLFISRSKMLIRPLIPPTLMHHPFENANQRIYMSATLGSGGELERIFGIPKIQRIPAVSDSESSETGRRFFIFPDKTFTFAQYKNWFKKRVESEPRTLILTPTYNHMKLIESFMGLTTHKFLHSTDIEKSLAKFVDNKNIVLLLTNRYGGLDLPGDKCQQLILAGVPAGVNLQERFFLEQLNLHTLLNDRILTRITQGVGRCNRGSTDNTLVIIRDQKLFDFIIRTENLEKIDPNLAAEIMFGSDNSDVSTLSEFDDNIKDFFEQNDNWKDNAEAEILAVKRKIKERRQERTHEDTITPVYKLIVANEVNFQYSLWNNKYERALQLALKIVENLAGDEFKHYRSWWYYIIGSLFYRKFLKDSSENSLKYVEKYICSAQSCDLTVDFFSSFKISEVLALEDDTTTETKYSNHNVSTIYDNLKYYGVSGLKFETAMNRIETAIKSTSSSQFETGLKDLGELLGFTSIRFREDGSPDVIWQIYNEFFLVFEAKSDVEPGKKIPKKDVLQTKGHYDFVNEILNPRENALKLSILTTYQDELHPSAVAFSKNLYYVPITQLKIIFKNISKIYRDLRKQMELLKEEDVKFKILELLKEKKLTPEDIIQEIKSNPLINLQ